MFKALFVLIHCTGLPLADCGVMYSKIGVQTKPQTRRADCGVGVFLRDRTLLTIRLWQMYRLQ